MLYSRKGTVYSRTKSVSGVSSYLTTGRDIVCNIQPISDSEGFDGMSAFNAYKMYTPDINVLVGDKVISEGTTYIVKAVSYYRGIMAKYSKCLIDESKGT